MAATAPDLGFLFNHAGHVVDTELTAKLAELGTTPREICVLGKAHRAELTQSRLGELAGLDKTTMVVTMDKLEQAGLAGQQVVDQAHADMLSALPEADREVFVRCMSTLVGDRLAKPVVSERSVRRRR